MGSIAYPIAAPNADICVQYGASAIVTDAHIFVTFNPFKVYVTQPRMQPGCVLLKREQGTGNREQGNPHN
ncbi:DUF3172 domain-containing protein [Nostoc sp.]|uniref:DUF3172 domain-containing protein n=1 Tax=Nostoc sp. TaxID=1180 RepID=UPI003FA57A87